MVLPHAFPPLPPASEYNSAGQRTWPAQVNAAHEVISDIYSHAMRIVEQEDTDGDFQISITDAGPKLVPLGTATSNGFKTFDIRVIALLLVHHDCS